MIQYFPLSNIKNQIKLAKAWVNKVAIAAHATHIHSKDQNQNIKNGSKNKFNKTVQSIILNGILTSHNHLIIDWNIEKPKTNIIQIKDILKKFNASLKTLSVTHIKWRRFGEKTYQITHIIIDNTVIINRVCAATWLTILKFFAQTYCAINVVHATANQAQSEIMKKVIGKLTDTEATASHPNLQTQNASVNWYALCSKFVKRIGIARVIIDFTIGQFKEISRFLFFIFFS